MIDLAGVRFDIEPAEALGGPEQEALARLGAGRDRGTGAANLQETCVRIRLTDEPPWTSANLALFQDRAPAVVHSHAGRVRVSHARFTAEVDPAASAAWLHRRDGGSSGLEITLRVAMCCALPRAGGLPLHAAGVIVERQGLVFFGPSGAGKSTLASLSPFPVLSDELVAVRGQPYHLVASGFWGELNRSQASAGVFPLRALVRLDKGERFELERLDTISALRSLVHVIMVPGDQGLWREAMVVAARLAAEVPTYRMAWSPTVPPWDSIVERLGGVHSSIELGEGRRDGASTRSPIPSHERGGIHPPGGQR